MTDEEDRWSMQSKASSDGLDVLIVGAGAASLVAARELLAAPSHLVKTVTIVEACSHIGGRIKSDDYFIGGGHRIDLGAEIVHGNGTILTDVIESKRSDWQQLIGEDEPLVEEVYIAAHADGGPQEHPTRDFGKYGVYYLAEEDCLLRFDTDDPDFLSMSEALNNLDGFAVDETKTEDEERRSLNSDGLQSIGSYLQANASVPKRMVGLLEASFGNTAACTDLDKISLQATCAFEKYWEESEEEGDVRLHSRIGMVGVIDTLREIIENDERLSILLNWSVGEINYDENGGALVTSENGETTIQADKVIITASPPVIASQLIDFKPQLPSWKLDAFSMVGMERAIKIIVRFRKRLWPEKVQNIISSDQPIPEIWFRDIAVEGAPEGENIHNEMIHLAVGFLTSTAAEELAAGMVCKADDTSTSTKSSDCWGEEAAANILKDQLALIFRGSFSRDEVEEAYVSAIVYDWGGVDTIRGGYIYPKVGCEPRHFAEMAQSISGVLYFAGEATNTGACCTVQAAMETGARAALEVLQGK